MRVVLCGPQSKQSAFCLGIIYENELNGYWTRNKSDNPNALLLSSGKTGKREQKLEYNEIKSSRALVIHIKVLGWAIRGR